MAPVPLRLRRSAPPGRGRRCSGSIRRRGPECPRLTRETIQGQPPRDTRRGTRARGRCYCFRRLGLGALDGAGIHPALPGDTSARPSICARSSSRKRAQSARRSSETNSPGSSDSRAGAPSGCRSGSRITPHSLWKLWVTRVCGERALHASGSGDEVAARLYAVAPGAPTTQTFGPTRPTGGRSRTQRSRLLVEAGAGRERLPHDARGVGERLPSPRLYTHCWQGHKTESRSAHTSQAVGAPGFEPGTSCPPDKRANQAAPRPVER